MPTPINWQIAATTEPGGFPKQNGTPTILSLTTPNDGHYHVVLVALTIVVTSTETGGIIQVQISGNSLGNIGGGAAAGTYVITTLGGGTALLLPPNTTVSIVQGTALTAGAATVVASLVEQQ
jgi:hypothetical protein